MFSFQEKAVYSEMQFNAIVNVFFYTLISSMSKNIQTIRFSKNIHPSQHYCFNAAQKGFMLLLIVHVTKRKITKMHFKLCR